jgi:hypothetical protein
VDGEDTTTTEPACAGCGRTPRDDKDWLWWNARDGVRGEVTLMCGDCDETEAAGHAR